MRSDHAPKNLRSDHAPSKNKYDRVPPKMEHGHFSNYGGTLFLAKFQIFFPNTASVILQPKGQSKSAPGTSFVKDSIKTRQYEVYFDIEFYDYSKRGHF